MTYEINPKQPKDCFDNFTIKFPSKSDSSNVFSVFVDDVIKAKEKIENDISNCFDVFNLENKVDFNSLLESTEVKDLSNNILDICATATNKKDGRITFSQQRKNGDCWLLSGINALSYSDKGKELIRNSLEYQRGYTIVHLDGLGREYKVSNTELMLAKYDEKFSSGDNDMKIFEIAMEKGLNDIAQGKISLNSDAPLYLEDMLDLQDDLETNNSVLWGGCSIEAITLLTGKVGYFVSDKEDIKKALDDFQKNENKDTAMGASIYNDKCVQDIKGKNVYLNGPHAYSIKKVDNDTVTVINPWDSKKKIILDKEVFAEAFDRLQVCDLSDNNQTQCFVSDDYSQDENYSYTDI